LKIGKACGDDGIYNLIKIWVYNLKDCFCRLF
jgi:hypothetical protein